MQLDFFRNFLLISVIQIQIFSGLSAALSDRLQFSEQTREYFLEETSLPSEPQFLESSEAKLKLKEEEKVKIEMVDLGGGRWRLIFAFPKPLSFSRKEDCNALLVAFNQPIDSPDLLHIQDKLGFIIKRFSNGYNTIYFVPKRPVSYQAEVCGQNFILEIIPDYYYPVEETRLLKVAYARLLVEKRYYKAAFYILSQMLLEYPDDKDFLVLYATLEGLLPRWQRQYQILYGVTQQNPLDADIRLLMYEAYSPHSSYISVERQLQRTVGLAAIQRYQLQGEQIMRMDLFHTLYAGAQFQLYRGHVGLIVNNQGNTEGFRGTRCQGNVYVRNEWAEGSHLTGVLYDQEGAVGVLGEAGFLLPSIQGGVNVITYWHRPYWAIFEALAFNGREDMFKVQMYSLYNRYFSFQLEAGAHRVGITGTPNGFSAIMASCQVFINLRVGNPIIAFNYGFDADYVTNEKVKIGISGNKYNPVPYVSFENHSVRAYLFYIWRQRWFITLFGGETFNRLGINARTYGASVKYSKPVPCGWELELSAYRFPSTTVSGATGEYYTATITKRF